MTGLAELRGNPNALACHYRRFAVSERLLLSGHSHQAWPDVAFDGVAESYDDAARYADEKWERAFAKADEVRRGFARLLGDPAAEIALGASTHDLMVRFLSALDLRRRPRIVTTDGEFHSLRRQLQRLDGTCAEVEWIASEPTATLAERLATAVDERTAAVLLSAVMFETAAVVGDLDLLAASCRRAGAELVVDVYHALGPVPMPIRELGLEDAWIVGGGYKYLQLGEGNCFLRLPAQAASMRPLVTGWFAEFDQREAPPGDEVAYGAGPSRFAGSTYDPTSNYRAARVFAFFAEMGLDAGFLAEVARHQVGLLADRFDALGLDPTLVDRDRSLAPERRGGFLALRTPRAVALGRLLAQRGVLSDSRGGYLRLGPAPYLSDRQLEAAVIALGEAAAELAAGPRAS